MAGITFGMAKDSLRMVVDNGVGATDPRVMLRTNEATQEILTELIPVNGMMIASCTTSKGFFLLPPQMESAIYVEVIYQSGQVEGSNDVTQGFYNILSEYTYIDPELAQDNPLVDFFLFPSADDPTVLQRRYFYPGLDDGATVQVIGPKRYLPIKSDTDGLIVQNVPALKLMIQAIEYRENRDPDSAAKYKALAIEMLQAEVKKHLMDPQWAMKRKGDYENDLVTYQRGQMAWFRARIALEVPGAIKLGKLAITRLVERAEERIMERGIFKGCIEEIEAIISNDTIYFPERVEAVLAASVCGEPIDVRSIFFKYLENGPGDCCGCSGRLEDLGLEYFAGSKQRRRKYRALIGSDGQVLKAVCKLRFVPKQPDEQMVIQNLEALRLMSDAIIQEQNEKWNEANAAKTACFELLDKELREYLSGIRETIGVSNVFDFSDIGGML